MINQERRLKKLAIFLTPILLVVILSLPVVMISEQPVSFHRSGELGTKISGAIAQYQRLRNELAELAGHHQDDFLEFFLPEARKNIWLIAFGTLLNRMLEAFFYPLFLIFAIGLGQNLLLSRLGQLGMVSLILGSIAICVIGIFPRTIALPHNLASIAFFVFVAMALLLIGAASVTASQMMWGLLSLVAGVLILVFQLVPWPWSGGAISQLLSCLPWSLWTIIFGARLLMDSSPIDI